jgi:hypothetical protein
VPALGIAKKPNTKFKESPCFHPRLIVVVLLRLLLLVEYQRIRHTTLCFESVDIQLFQGSILLVVVVVVLLLLLDMPNNLSNPRWIVPF